MLFVVYFHELYGIQEIQCKELIQKDNLLHAINIHGVTFQTLNPNRIISVSFI